VPIAPPSAVATTLPVGHPTSVVFLDETGVLHPQPTDTYFGIGCLKASDPSVLLRDFKRLREGAGFHDELHWADFDKAKTKDRPDLIALAKNAIDLVFNSHDAFFCCTIADRGHGDLRRRFKDHPHPAAKAYESLAADVLSDLIAGEELITVLADQISTHPDVRFEKDVASAVNKRQGRLAIASVSRLDSRAHDGLQLVDLLLGAAAFDLRRGEHGGNTQKQQLLGHLLDRCGCASFRPNGRSDPEGTRYNVTLLKPPRRSHRGRRA
jgi:hypothetical protein